MRGILHKSQYLSNKLEYLERSMRCTKKLSPLIIINGDDDDDDDYGDDDDIDSFDGDSINDDIDGYNCDFDMKMLTP